MLSVIEPVCLADLKINQDSMRSCLKVLTE